MTTGGYQQAKLDQLAFVMAGHDGVGKIKAPAARPGLQFAV
jgi:hypothetical protein